MPSRPHTFVGYRPVPVLAWREHVAWMWRMSLGRVELLRWVSGVYPSARAMLDRLMSEDARMPERPTALASDDGGLVPHADGGAWKKSYPHLVEWMTASSWPDRSPRRGCLLMISARGGQWRGTLKEYEAGVELEVVVAHPEQVIPALDALLGKPQPPWRACPDSKGPPKGGRRK